MKILLLMIMIGIMHPSTICGQSIERPNVVLVFVDDLGVGDVEFTSPKEDGRPKTLNLNRMAKEGMQFTDFYVGCAVCSGSRTALLTGCHYQRLSMKPVLFPNSDRGLHPDEVTIADMLKQAGYQTACVGKWHLGHLHPCLPSDQGFDSYFGVPYSNDMWIDPANLLAENIDLRNGVTLQDIAAGKTIKNAVPLFEGDQIVEYPCDQMTLTQRYTERAVQFIRQNRERPFFLYLPHTMVHLPLAASKSFQGRNDKPLWDAVEEVDWSVGQILETIKELGIENNTLVIFTSDNGAAVGSSKPFRAKKASVYEGGIREPTLMWWPGTVPAGSTCERIVATIDVLPTLAAICGGELPERKIDGVDFSTLLTNPDTDGPRDHYVLHHGPGTVRQGKWKYYPWREKKQGRDAPVSRPPSPLPVQLYDLSNDIGEDRNLAEQYPEICKKLQAMYDRHVAELAENRRPTAVLKRPGGSPPAKRPARSSVSPRRQLNSCGFL